MVEAREPPFGHESPGVATTKVVGVVVTVGVLVAIALVAIWFSLTYLVIPDYAQRRTQPEVLPPEPRLQPSPDDDLTALRAQKRALLEGYAWIDPSHRFARIPIQRAMEIYVREHEAGTGNGERGTEGNSTGPGTRDPGQKPGPGTRDRGPGAPAASASSGGQQ